MRYAQKTQDALPLLPLNHPSKLMPSRLGAHIHVSKASAHLSTIIFTSTDHKTSKHQADQPAAGVFWPMVRERMKTKALQLYRLDHPETQEEPTTKELNKAGYMKIAKTEALREIQAETKARAVGQ